jgi:hypothetical protein
VLVVCPPAPLETNPQVDMSLQTFELLQSGQLGVSLPNTSFSNWQPHPSHWYSKIGILGLSPSQPTRRRVNGASALYRFI